MRISDGSSDVCSSDLGGMAFEAAHFAAHALLSLVRHHDLHAGRLADDAGLGLDRHVAQHLDQAAHANAADLLVMGQGQVDRRLQPAAQEFRREGEDDRSEEHTSELQSLMRISYAVFCLKKKTT